MKKPQTNKQNKKFRSAIVEDFLNNFVSSSTKRGYRCHLKDFFEVINKNPEAYIKDVRRLENGERLDALDEYEKDITKYWQSLMNRNYSPKTVTNAVNCIRVFLKQYRITLDEVFWENIRRRGTGNKPVTQELEITHDILHKILIHGDAKARAMFLTIASSGIRIGEAVNLDVADVDFSSHPTKLIIKYTGAGSVKTKSSRITYISDEATSALKEWLKTREKALDLAIKRTNIPNKQKTNSNNKLFPYTTSNMRTIWNNLLAKADLDDLETRNGRHLIHIHGLRKFFRTQMSKQNRDIAELLMGHEGYLATAYLRFTPDEVKQQYLEGMKNLYIFERPIEDSERVKELQKEYQAEINKLQEQLADQQQKLQQLTKPEVIEALLSVYEKNQQLG